MINIEGRFQRRHGLFTKLLDKLRSTCILRHLMSLNRMTHFKLQLFMFIEKLNTIYFFSKHKKA